MAYPWPRGEFQTIYAQFHSILRTLNTLRLYVVNLSCKNGRNRSIVFGVVRVKLFLCKKSTAIRGFHKKNLEYGNSGRPVGGRSAGDPSGGPARCYTNWLAKEFLHKKIWKGLGGIDVFHSVVKNVSSKYICFYFVSLFILFVRYEIDLFHNILIK